jgi:hypothetical protein
MDIDETTSLFEHIRNRLPPGFGLGDDETVEIDKVPDHKVWQQSLREDHEADVGVFEINTTDLPLYLNSNGYLGEVQIAVVSKNGDIENAKNYLKKAFENINENPQSTSIYVIECKLINLTPVGKSSVGFHIVTMDLSIKYAVL